jgi:hypothetical protein
MPGDSETCRARALRCLEVAEKAPTPGDRREFLTFAESWERLANEIERNERLVTLIEELAAKNLTNENTQPDSDELAECQRAGTRSLRRLAASIVSIPGHFGTQPDEKVGPDEEVGEVRASRSSGWRGRQER